MLTSPTDSTAPQVERMFNFLIHVDNIYIQVESGILKQVINILMGTDLAPLTADLFCSLMNFIL